MYLPVARSRYTRGLMASGIRARLDPSISGGSCSWCSFRGFPRLLQVAQQLHRHVIVLQLWQHVGLSLVLRFDSGVVALHSTRHAELPSAAGAVGKVVGIRCTPSITGFTATSIPLLTSR
jgi:hypothetical protein